LLIKKKKKLDAVNDLVKILIGIEYNQLFNENNYKNNENNKNGEYLDEIINDPKYSNRDKLIKEMNYYTFCSNCKNSKIIEILFKDGQIHEEILKKFSPILFVMYKNNFGYNQQKANQQEIEHKMLKVQLNSQQEDMRKDNGRGFAI